MNRQRGFSTIAMVMMLLVTGGILLQGLDRHLRAQSSSIASERDAIMAFNSALSAQAWGRTLHWQPDNTWQCQTMQAQQGRACIKSVGKGEILMAAEGDPAIPPITLWRWGSLTSSGGFSPNGWIDTCPISEAALCLLP